MAKCQWCGSKGHATAHCPMRPVEAVDLIECPKCGQIHPKYPLGCPN